MQPPPIIETLQVLEDRYPRRLSGRSLVGQRSRYKSLRSSASPRSSRPHGELFVSGTHPTHRGGNQAGFLTSSSFLAKDKEVYSALPPARKMVDHSPARRDYSSCATVSAICKAYSTKYSVPRGASTMAQPSTSSLQSRRGVKKDERRLLSRKLQEARTRFSRRRR